MQKSMNDDFEIRIGTVLLKSDSHDPDSITWDRWVVKSIHEGIALLKRPYTNVGKTFVEFEECLVPIIDIPREFSVFRY